MSSFDFIKKMSPEEIRIHFDFIDQKLQCSNPDIWNSIRIIKAYFLYKEYANNNLNLNEKGKQK